MIGKRSGAFMTLALVGIVAACAADVASSPSGLLGTMRVTSNAPKHTTGQDIFRGVIFMDGEIAQVVPEIRERNELRVRVRDTAAVRNLRTFQDKLIKQIEHDDKSFFATFASRMSSGNPQQVDLAMRTAYQTSIAAIRALPEIRKIREDMQKHPEKFAALREAVHEAKRELEQKPKIVLPVREGRSEGAARVSLKVGGAIDTAGADASRLSDMSEAGTPVDTAMAYMFSDEVEEYTGDVSNLWALFKGFIIVSAAFIANQVVVAQTYGIAINAAIAFNVYFATNVYDAASQVRNQPTYTFANMSAGDLVHYGDMEPTTLTYEQYIESLTTTLDGYEVAAQ